MRVTWAKAAIVLSLLPSGSLSAADTVLFVPAAAHAPGAGGSSWRTELVLFNPGPASLSVSLTFLPAGPDNRSAPEVAVTVPARRTLVLPDVVDATLHASGGGGLRLRASAPFLATSRTANESGTCGNVGVAVGAVDAGAAVTRGVVAKLGGEPGRRSNLGFLNPGETAVAVTYRLRDVASGVVVAESRVDLPALGFAQVNDVVRPAAGATLEVESASPVLAFGTDVESASGDGSFFLARADPAPPAASAGWWEPYVTIPKARGLAWQVESGLRVSGMGGPPRVIVLPDGRLRLFYNAAGGLVSATSTNGRDFTPDPGTRTAAGDPAVIYRKDGGYRFLMPEGTPGSFTLVSWVSPDGLAFTREAGVRFRPQAGDAGFVQVPHTVKLPDGRWRLYYVADWYGTGGGVNRNNTRSALSTDEGLTWTAEKGSELTGPDTVDPDVVSLEGGGYRLYHKYHETFRAVDSEDGASFPGFSTAVRQVLDAKDRVDPTVLRMPDGTLRMYFGTVGGMGSAVATD